jgi:hypothetical protein
VEWYADLFRRGKKDAASAPAVNHVLTDGALPSDRQPHKGKQRANL